MIVLVSFTLDMIGLVIRICFEWFYGIQEFCNLHILLNLVYIAVRLSSTSNFEIKHCSPGERLFKIPLVILYKI